MRRARIEFDLDRVDDHIDPQQRPELQLRLTADAGKHPEAYSLLQRHVLEPRSRALTAALRAAQKTGQIRDGEVTWLVRAFFGALLSCTFQHPNRS
ncbi:MULTISPECIES: hypothetical protein [Rhodococcus]|uniref:Uncharacterized protein n=1 Tax=Rhodococcus oxybenzonivorans TaxID=1990687 RepID=A0AAE4UYM7_9NOCA|nr:MULTISPECIES: hypothetical protein [Rhodococcus]MDV7241863.1 hypothetical protein [Rhodococcus oxybenzonivorans]MDV7265483.1 hypothetical protein [Rhodococcus oxybenzonivorans]MDV7273603.1 hypothetical protein [Rhodococcus oxybenzonivorans]MDV7334145.1 hypothetical protein [Rhodococcus oxybenzonivorans]MDV7343564.1 hypothetical protein [Rhodococcus oxybenzonivorans]